MKKYIQVQMILWGLIGLTALGFLIFALSGIGLGVSRKTETYFDQSYSVSGLQSIDLKVEASAVNFYKSDTNELRIIQSGRGISDEEIVYVDIKGDMIYISKSEERFFSMSFMSFNRKNSIDIYLPESFMPSLKTRLMASGANFKDSFEFENLDIKLEAASFDSDYALSAKEARFDLGASSVELEKLSCDYFNIDIGAGSCEIDALEGGGKIAVAAGSFYGSHFKLLGDLDLSVQAGSLELELLENSSFFFEGEVSAGSIETFFHKNISGGGAVITVGNSPEWTIKADVSAGSIEIYEE